MSARVGLMPAPETETPNFDDMSGLQAMLLAVYISTSVLATVGICLRMYTGACLVGKLGLDAVFLLTAWAVYLASFIGMVKVMPCGFGKHLWSVTNDGLACYKNMLLFLGISYFWPPTLAKLSLVILYHRINPGKRYRVALYIIASALIVYTVTFTIVLTVPCNPLLPGTTNCLDNCALAQAILNISTDTALIIMPIITVWGLQLPVKQKLAVGSILVLGSAAVVASCVRIVYVRAMLHNSDVLYTQASAAVWSAVEINIGILCNCLAMLKPFVRRHLPWLRNLVGQSTSPHSNGRVRGLSGSVACVKNLSGRGNKRRAALVKDGNLVSASGSTDHEMYGHDHSVKDDGEDHEYEGTRRKRQMVHDGIMVTMTVTVGRTSEGDASIDDIFVIDVGHAV